MSAPILKPFTVQLHRRGGNTTGRIEVMARCDKHAGRVAVEQTIATSYPKSKPAAWIVDKVEARAIMTIDYKGVMRLIRSKRAQHNPSIGVVAWNNAVSVGQWVDYRSDPHAEPQRFRTRCLAEVLSGHTAVVWLEGKSGCVTLDSLTVVPLPEGGAS